MLKEKLNAFIGVIKKNAQPLVFSAISGWLLTASLFLIFSKHVFIEVPTYVNSIPVIPFILLVIAIGAAFYCLNHFWLKKSLFLIMPLTFLLFGAVSVALSANNAATRAYSAFIFAALGLVILILCINYAKDQRIKLPTKDIPFAASLTFVIIAFVILSAYWIFMLWTRLKSYYAPGFDMGIFMQAYDNMIDPAHGFQPITTCERGCELTHFAVHFSPILYLLMPFCFFLDIGAVLVSAQIILVLSGVFPMFLICRQLKLSNVKTTVISFLYLLYPAMSSGSFYDFHENAFLAPLILWTLYFSHKKKWYNTLLMFVFALLVLAVKEDAAIYVAFIALYMILGHRRYIAGAFMFALSVAYFFFAIAMIAYFQQGMALGAEGNMLGSRFAHIIGAGAGFSELIKVLILNPSLYIVKSLNINKLIYILNMLLPLAFLPIITRKPSRWILLGPLYILNIVPDYSPQHDIGYQYSFGSGALLVYLAALNLSDLSGDIFFPERDVDDKPTESVAASDSSTAEDEPETVDLGEIEGSAPAAVAKPQINIKRRFISFLSAIALVFAIFSSVFIQAGRAPYHFTFALRLYDKEHKDIPPIITEVIDDIKENHKDKSIMATSMLVTPLYEVEQLYDQLQALKIYDIEINGKKYNEYKIIYYTDIVVLDLRSTVSSSKHADLWTSLYEQQGYEIIEERWIDKVDESGNESRDYVIRVLQRTELSPPVGYSEEYLKEIGMSQEPENDEIENENDDLDQNVDENIIAE